MLLAGIDFETTGLDVEEDLVIEFAVVTWDTEESVPVCMYSAIVKERGFVEIKNPTSGITSELVLTQGVGPLVVCRDVWRIVRGADYFVAHFGNSFDYPVFDNFLKRCSFQAQKTPELFAKQELHHFIKKKVWIDTAVDIDYPPICRYRELTYLCAHHGFLNPFSHRALPDALSMMQILSKYDIHKVVGSAKSPMMTLQAMVDYDHRQLAKDVGFYWDPNGKQGKGWYKDLKRIRAQKLDLPFEVRVV